MFPLVHLPIQSVAVHGKTQNYSDLEHLRYLEGGEVKGREAVALLHTSRPLKFPRSVSTSRVHPSARPALAGLARGPTRRADFSCLSGIVG